MKRVFGVCLMVALCSSALVAANPKAVTADLNAVFSPKSVRTDSVPAVARTQSAYTGEEPQTPKRLSKGKIAWIVTAIGGAVVTGLVLANRGASSSGGAAPPTRGQTGSVVVINGVPQP